MTTEDYGSHTEADAGLWAAAHAEPDENPMTLADVADDAERDTSHVCSGYCDPAGGLTVLSAVFGHVVFQVGAGPECVAGVVDLREAKTEFDGRDRVLVHGERLDESDVDLLLTAAMRSQISTSALRGTSA